MVTLHFDLSLSPKGVALQRAYDRETETTLTGGDLNIR